MIPKGNGRKRVVIDRVTPQIDGGRFPIKRTAGQKVDVRAHAFVDRHDQVRVELLYRKEGQKDWTVEEMVDQGRDEWTAGFQATELGDYAYTVRGWVDTFGTWQSDLRKRHEAGLDVTVDVKIGARLVHAAARRAASPEAKRLEAWAKSLSSRPDVKLALSEELTEVVRKYPDRSLATTYERQLPVMVDHRQAVFSAWYELFPRSFGRGGRHGTLADCESLLPKIAKMGFDILYLPPIGPIGQTGRKGRNDSTQCLPGDPGCPWAIGSAQGGHKAIDFQLGSLASFRRFVKKAKEHGLDIAMDLAFQCSPDHPYVTAHPEWFRWRPDGTIQYAQNPPKEYRDILPLNFETRHWQSLWEELKSIVVFWIEQGVRVFRVDNPHTKPFGFWEWLIGEIRRDRPDVILLAEAFTRRKIMQRLAKLGFNQSYTYFTWRNTKAELEQYIQELTRTELAEYFRPNFWPNTPDLLPPYLQSGGRAAFIIRLVLAATLSGSYGIYGPAFELCIDEAFPGTEEYLDSEKYEIKRWTWTKKGNIRSIVERVNRVRRRNASLQQTQNVEVCGVTNENMVCYVKTDDKKFNITVTVVSLDPRRKQSGEITLPLEILGLDANRPYMMHDLLGGERQTWRGKVNGVEIDPQIMPARIFHLRPKATRDSNT